MRENGRERFQICLFQSSFECCGGESGVKTYGKSLMLTWLTPELHWNVTPGAVPASCCKSFERPDPLLCRYDFLMPCAKDMTHKSGCKKIADALSPLTYSSIGLLTTAGLALLVATIHAILVYWNYRETKNEILPLSGALDDFEVNI
jgi:hypothetical protein